MNNETNKNELENEKVYIFISHSHKDIEKVRKIRNYLESLDCEPILFFLKSKDDEDEIIQLIKDEIDARVWFIYCRSINASKSKWVNDEVTYVEQTGKNNIVIDIDGCLDENGELKNSVKNKLNVIINGFRNLQQLYISYSHKDSVEVLRIVQFLKRYGVDLFYDDMTHFGLDCKHSIHNQIVKSPYFLVFLSKQSINSHFIYDEIQLAQYFNKEIIPVILYNNINDYYSVIESDVFQKNFAYFLVCEFDTSSDVQFKVSSFRLLNTLLEHFFTDFE